MIALAILSVSLVAIIGINGGTVSAHTYAKQVTVATMLARSKMNDLESQFTKEGFTSQFDETMEGDFSEEGWDAYRWKAEIVKPDLDAANATGMVQQLVEQFAGDAETAAAQAKDQTAAPVPTTPASSQIAAMQPMIEAQVTKLTETLEKAVREVRLKVFWKDGANEESLEVVTHLVVLAPAGQPGGESLDPDLDAQLPASATQGQQQGGLPTGNPFNNLPTGPGTNPFNGGLGGGSQGSKK
jgi:general secretion pathway protein I